MMDLERKNSYELNLCRTRVFPVDHLDFHPGHLIVKRRYQLALSFALVVRFGCQYYDCAVFIMLR